VPKCSRAMTGEPIIRAHENSAVIRVRHLPCGGPGEDTPTSPEPPSVTELLLAHETLHYPPCRHGGFTGLLLTFSGCDGVAYYPVIHKLGARTNLFV
jgi:hypothetical protein